MSRDRDPLYEITPYFDFPPPHCLFTVILLGAPKKIYGYLLVRPLILKQNPVKIFQVQTKIGQILVVLGGWAVRWYEKF